MRFGASQQVVIGESDNCLTSDVLGKAFPGFSNISDPISIKLRVVEGSGNTLAHLFQ